jgi:hypothetical protein
MPAIINAMIDMNIEPPTAIARMAAMIFTDLDLLF